jgi:hypothetical protein
VIIFDGTLPLGDRGEVQMGAMPRHAQSESYKGLLPIELSGEAPAVFTADLKKDWFTNAQPSASKETSGPISRFLMPFCIGVAATLTWQSYSDAAGSMIAKWSPQLAWLAPQAPASQTSPNTIELITTRIIDRIVTSIAATQEPIVRTVEHLAAGQEQLTREMIKLEAISQYGLSKSLDPPPRQIHAATPKLGTRVVR